MDLGLRGRTAFLDGPADGALEACVRMLTVEGAAVTEQVSGSDIVVMIGHRHPGSNLLGVEDAAQLYAAWDDATEAIAVYRSALPHMAERGWGRLVWVGTAQAKSVDSEQDELAAVVSLGMLGLHKVLAVEAGSSAVTANAVLRGGNASDDDVASTVAFLCSEGAAYLSGITITVDGGAGSAVF